MPLTAYPDELWKPFATDCYTEFLIRTGQPATRIMSALEWWTMYRWLKDGIPLHAVLRGLRDCEGKGKTLTYFDAPVRQAWADQQKALAV